MPSLAKTSIAAALSWSGTHRWFGRRPSWMPLILGYHRVVERVDNLGPETFPGMVVAQATLRAQLEWVARRYRIVSLDEIGAVLEQGRSCGHLAAVTFDDGYRDVYDNALPVLEQLGVPAATFVVTGLLEDSSPPLHDRLYGALARALQRDELPASLVAALEAGGAAKLGAPLDLLHAVRTLLSKPRTELARIAADLGCGAEIERGDAPATIDRKTLVAMHRRGVTIGSHTHSHALLDHEDDVTVREELERSRFALEAELGVPVRHFAYPDGRFSRRVAGIVGDVGYRFAYTICHHWDPSFPLFTIPRVMLWEASCMNAFGRFSPSIMRCHASATLPFPPPCHDEHGFV